VEKWKNVEEWVKRRDGWERSRGDGWSGEMFDWENMEEGEEEEWLGEVKRRDGWSGEMFDWENMEGEEEEWMKWRRCQRGGMVGVEKCLIGRTWKVKRRSGEW